MNRRARNSSTSIEDELCDIFLTNSQNAQMRSSPPIQPNEHGYADKLPSFSEFLDTTRAHTPPRTPSRRQGSNNSSPHLRPEFEDVAWQDASRRRVDTLGDIYAHPRLSDRIGAQAYAYDHPQDAYYGRPSYSGSAYPSYETGYNEVRFHHNVGMDQNSFNRKRRGNLPKDATNILKNWFQTHRSQPYPTEDQKIELCQVTQLTMNQVFVVIDVHTCFCQPTVTVNQCLKRRLFLCHCYVFHMHGADSSQVSNWFINARRRAPQKEAREREANGGLSDHH
ncbi:hypothetical protein BDU57DRAFT_450235 [Ampelomyces quisqualis]|uniref:Homeobox domain-containing protein n=1 Tax=Ampelomyces quisqualis TaxID=50730 RepID=A0A6A5QK26_AMPQU|nr:hypothetical protein BDU57DRAFT_450235 [Ampelomyces quisqualis]